MIPTISRIPRRQWTVFQGGPLGMPRLLPYMEGVTHEQWASGCALLMPSRPPLGFGQSPRIKLRSLPNDDSTQTTMSK